jgi:uncharacterized membrane protein
MQVYSSDVVIQGADSTIAFLNVFFLLFMTFVPFTVDVLAIWRMQYYAAILFTTNLVLIGIAMVAMWLYAVFKRRFVHDQDRLSNGTITAIAVRLAFSPVIFVIALAVSPGSVWAALAVGLLVPLNFLFASFSADFIEWAPATVNFFIIRIKTGKWPPTIRSRSDQSMRVPIIHNEKNMSIRTLECRNVRKIKRIKAKMNLHDESEGPYWGSEEFEEKMVERIKSFCDAVFSIVITFMILSLHAPAMTLASGSSEESATESTSHSLMAIVEEVINATTNSTHNATEVLTDAEWNVVLGQKLFSSSLYPTYISFVITVLLTSTYWKSHVYVMRGIIRTNRRFIFANIIFLVSDLLVALTKPDICIIHTVCSRYVG